MLENDRKAPLSPKDIAIDAFDYPLPDERIARFPLAERDASKLLIYKNNTISESIFSKLDEHLPEGAVLVFNDTRVIHARFRFILDNGKPIEVFCLEPLTPHDYAQNLSARENVVWKCLVGGNRHWKSGILEQSASLPDGRQVTLRLERQGYDEGAFAVKFSWQPAHLTFAELLAGIGIIPLPPYLKRESEASDAQRYQTVYAREQGSVAAPTAGLHFTPQVFERLRQKGIDTLFVTLHVGAGTFKPVQTATLADHHMHEEVLHVSADAIKRLSEAKASGKPVIAVGTTSMRTLESLYWHGLDVLAGKRNAESLSVRQWDPYELHTDMPHTADALLNLHTQLAGSQHADVQGATQLLVAPGYQPRIVDALITNFHQPKSTLLLLIAALTGHNWRGIYQYALERDFRFLSYGDGSLLWKE